MKKSTDEYPPKFIILIKPGIVLILKFVKRAVPGDWCLLPWIVISDENEKSQDVDDAEDKGRSLYCHSGEEDLTYCWSAFAKKFVWCYQSVLFVLSCSLFINTFHLALRASLNLFTLIVCDWRLRKLLVIVGYFGQPGPAVLRFLFVSFGGRTCVKIFFVRHDIDNGSSLYINVCLLQNSLVLVNRYHWISFKS